MSLLNQVIEDSELMPSLPACSNEIGSDLAQQYKRTALSFSLKSLPKHPTYIYWAQLDLPWTPGGGRLFSLKDNMDNLSGCCFCKCLCVNWLWSQPESYSLWCPPASVPSLYRLYKQMLFENQAALKCLFTFTRKGHIKKESGPREWAAWLKLKFLWSQIVWWHPILYVSVSEFFF